MVCPIYSKNMVKKISKLRWIIKYFKKNENSFLQTKLSRFCKNANNARVTYIGILNYMERLITQRRFQCHSKCFHIVWKILSIWKKNTNCLFSNISKDLEKVYRKKFPFGNTLLPYIQNFNIENAYVLGFNLNQKLCKPTYSYTTVWHT